MPEYSIMKIVNNTRPLYDDKNGLYRKWIREGKDWNLANARKEARALAAHFAEAIETIVHGKYSSADINKAAEEMIEEFETEERPQWS